MIAWTRLSAALRNASSNSSALRIGKGSILTPIVAAAASVFRRCAVLVSTSDSHSMAAWDSPGMSSRKSSKRLLAKSAPIFVTPVTLPPGRAKLAIRPRRTGSSSVAHNYGYCRRRALGGLCRLDPHHDNAIGLKGDEFGSKRSKPIRPSHRVAHFDDEILPLDVTVVAHRSQKCLSWAAGDDIGRQPTEPVHLPRLLPVGCPCQQQGGECQD